MSIYVRARARVRARVRVHGTYQMVNTFLVLTDYLQSARLLDHKRLPNQRREAFQILCHVQRLKAMGLLVGNPLPTDPYHWYTWIRVVIKQY